jgi:type I restriction enzyme S subunit
MGFRQTEIGSLPTDWEVSDIGNCFAIKQGKQLSAKHRRGTNERPFLRTSNVFWGKLDLVDLDEMHFTVEETNELALRSGDLLVCEGGEIGRTAIWQDNLKDCYYQNHLHRMRAKDNDTNTHFYMYWLMYGFSVGKIYFGLGNKTTIPNLSQSRLKSLLIPCPLLVEQQNISHILSKIQSAIETQEKIIQTATALRKALMQKLFAEGLNGEPQKDTEIGLVPRSWQVVQLADAVSYIDYGFSQAIPKTPIKDGVKIVSTADISKDGKLLYYKIRKVIAPVKTTARLTLKDGDVLFNWRNTAELIGKTAVFQSQPEPHIFASFVLRIRCDEKKIHNRFLCYLMNHFREKGVFVKLSRRAVNQANYNKNEISVLPIPLPTYQEQVEIAEALSIVERKIDSSKSIKAKYESLFASALHHLMTGQIRVKDVRFS